MFPRPYVLVLSINWPTNLHFTRRDLDLIYVLRPLKLSLNSGYWNSPLNWSNSGCLNHNLSFVDPNSVIQIFVQTRHLGEKLL